MMRASATAEMHLAVILLQGVPTPKVAVVAPAGLATAAHDEPGLLAMTHHDFAATPAAVQVFESLTHAPRDWVRRPEPARAVAMPAVQLAILGVSSPMDPSAAAIEATAVRRRVTQPVFP